MRQASLKFKMYMDKVNIIDNNNLPHRVLHSMLIMFGALALAYVFILGNMVINIIERRVLEKEAIALGNQVGDLELNYLSISNKVDLNLSYSMGFREVKPVFATRKSLSANTILSLKRDNEI